MNKKLPCSRSFPRRFFLKRIVSAATIAHVAPRLLTAEKEATHGKVTREVFVKSPGKGTAVMAFAYYTRPKGLEMMSIEQRWSRSDTIDVAYFRRSRDYGQTWSAPLEVSLPPQAETDSAIRSDVPKRANQGEDQRPDVMPGRSCKRRTRLRRDRSAVRR